MVKIFTFTRFAFGICLGLGNLCWHPQKPHTISVWGVVLVSCLARLLCRTNRVFLRSGKKGIGSLWAYPFAYNTTFALFVKSKVQNLHLGFLRWCKICTIKRVYTLYFVCSFLKLIFIVKLLSSFYQVLIHFLHFKVVKNELSICYTILEMVALL